MDKESSVPDRPNKDEAAGLPRADMPPMGASAAKRDVAPVESAPSQTDTRTGLPSTLSRQPVVERDDRAGVFRDLVTDDSDITGLVAYSIYKQNKLDWLNAFEVEKKRAPNADELAAYIIGEGTPRRLATYRHLAEATLAGNGPDVGNGTPGPRVAVGRHGRNVAGLPTAVVASYALIAVLLLVIILFVARYAVGSH